MMYLALSYDHRVVDGREAVSFLVAVKERLEAPERLMLEILSELRPMGQVGQLLHGMRETLAVDGLRHVHLKSRRERSQPIFIACQCRERESRQVAPLRRGPEPAKE